MPLRPLVDFQNFFPSEVIAFVSDRAVDFSFAKSDSLLTKQQRELLSSQCGIWIEQLRNIKQIHGRRVIYLSQRSCWRPQHQRKADGSLTTQVNVPLTVRTADCLSVFIYDQKHKAIGLVHAGWKGTRKNVVGRTLQLMKKMWGTNPGDLRVAFGPSIKACCYQVGKEFQGIFPDEIQTRAGALYLDLPLVAKRQLLKAGVIRRNIYDCGICTGCDNRCFSYRREGSRAGRMISVMMLKTI